MNNFGCVRASSWFPADLQNMLIWLLKFSLPSIGTQRILTDGIEEMCLDLKSFCYYEAN